MADTKEETAIDNSGKQIDEQVEVKRPVQPGFEGIQLFYEKNKNLVNYLGGGLLIVIAGLLYFKLFYLPEQETMAANEMYHAQKYFEQDSFRVALNGGVFVMSPDGQKQMMGFQQVADEYGMTRSGNLAHFYAGICLLRTGQFDAAIEQLESYDGQDEILAPISIGAIGDCHLEMNRLDDAVKFYLKAADKRDNSFTTPLYLRKAGFAQEMNKDYSGAANSYDRIMKEFPNSSEGRDIQRDLARAKALGNVE
jgi:tetratricopeptide (TPR) repeat protein